MHREGAPMADRGKMTIADFVASRPYSSVFFASDRQNPIAKASISLTTPNRKPNFTSATDELSLLMMKHEDLLNRHKNCLSHLQKTFKEAETLRQENTNLRCANRDLNDRLNILLGYLQNNYASMIASGSGSSSTSPENLGSVFNPVSSKISQDCEIPVSVLENDLAEKDGRVSLPKSISVRSKGFLKADQVSAAPKSEESRTGSLVPIDAPQKVYVRAKNKKGDPIELEVYNQGTSKTELCNKWQESGSCPYGENCQFAHGIDELRPVLRHPRYKTEVCRMVLSGDDCPYGHRCHFRHALSEQEKNIAPLKLD